MLLKLLTKFFVLRKVDILLEKKYALELLTYYITCIVTNYAM